MTQAVGDPGAASAYDCRIKVRYAETDQMRFVYYANHFVYYEVARTEWLASRAMPYHVLESTGFAIPVLEAHCRYIAPARYGDDLVVRVRHGIEGARIRFDYRTFRGSSEGAILAEGWTVHVCMDRDGKPRRPSAELRSILERP